jgi:hypothetical protein
MLSGESGLIPCLGCALRAPRFPAHATAFVVGGLDASRGLRFGAIIALRNSEQSALQGFVMSGGTALIFSDNSTFDSNAPAANASLLSPVGVTAVLRTGDFYDASRLSRLRRNQRVCPGG